MSEPPRPSRHGLPLAVAGDEALRDHRRAGDRAETGDQRLVAVEVAGGREIGARAGAARILAGDQRCRARRARRPRCPCDSRKAAPRRVDRSSPKAITRALSAGPASRSSEAARARRGELLEVGLQQRGGGEAEPARQLQVALLDRRQRLLVARRRRRRRGALRAGRRSPRGPSRRRAGAAPRPAGAGRGRAIVAQRAGVETLVPPNLRTTQGGATTPSPPGPPRSAPAAPRGGRRRCRSRRW